MEVLECSKIDWGTLCGWGEHGMPTEAFERLKLFRRAKTGQWRTETRGEATDRIPAP